MTKGRLGGHLRTRRLVLALATVFAAAAAFMPTPAFAVPPFDGTTVSAGLGPTFGDPWCAPAAAGSSIANMQGSPLALIPYEAIGCTLAKIQTEATAASIPPRMTYSIIGQSAGGRDMYGVVVNALETAEQQRDYARWQQLRAMELTDPTNAQILLDSWGGDVKMPVFIEANIHGDEEEGADAMMQVLRDIVTTPYGVNATVDKILDHTILILIPSQNPDGRFIGQRANANNFDMNRDFIVQSQAETRTSIKLQQQWLATVGLAMHGYVNPTLIDGLTKPHNPGLEYDLFAYWNQRRLDANQAALSAVGMGITRPVNQYNSSGSGTSGNPGVAEGWDDWGPFYTQTYMAFYGPDSSTLEMCSSGTGCNGRFGSKRAQYIGFYSSANYWIDNRQGLMHDQVEIFRRGVTDADRSPCCTDPLLTLRGFTEAQHNWMIPFPKAYVIPFNGGGQRSNGEANRMAKWLLDNGIQVTRMNSDFTWGSTTYPAGSYVVWMNQALRGLALTVLNAGQDISTRITQLYAPPGAWSHGLMWGADVVEIPRGDASFAPPTTPISAPNTFPGGLRDGAAAPSDFYSVTLRGPTDVRAMLSLLRSGVSGEIAEASFTSTTGGLMPAGTLIFPNDAATKAALDASGLAGGMYYERNVGVTKPATTKLSEAPKVAILVNSANPANSDTSQGVKAIFGPDAVFVSVLTGANSIQLAPTDPLAGIDVIYNTGQGYPASTNTTARARLNAFFARGGGYIGTAVSTTNYSFLTGAVPALVTGSFTQTSSSAGGGITNWNNVGGTDSPLTGGYPAIDYLFMPSNVTYFTATPTGAVIDGRNNANMVGSSSNGPSPGFVAGLWRSRASTANNAPVIVHGNTTANSRYLGFSANPFSRQDAEREWTLIGQAALWSNLTDEATSAIGFPADGAPYSSARFDAGCPTAGFCGTASNGSGPAAIAKVRVAVQQASSGSWWDGSAFASATPVYADATGTTTWSFAFPAAQFPADGTYVVRSKAIDAGGNEQLVPASATFLIDTVNPTSTIGFPANGGIYNAAVWAAGCGTPADDICGTAADGGSGPESVRWSLRRSSTGLYWDGSSFASASQVFIPADGAASWSDDFAFSLFPGDDGYLLSVRATDRAGNEEATSTASFVVDTTPPVSNAVLSGTLNLGWWRNPTVTITSTDGAGNAGVQKIEYRLDGGPWITYGGAFGVSGDGSRLLEYRATDNLGHVEATKSLAFLVDGNAPTTSSSLSPPPTAGFYRTPLVTLTADDGLGAGAAAIQYTVDGSGTRSYSGPFFVTGDGPHTITYRAVDLTGLIETFKTLTFSSDASAPASTAALAPSTITGFHTNPTTVTLSASDFAGGSGVASIRYMLDAGSWTEYTGPFSVGGDGSHTVQFHATDNAGNVESVKTKSFTIDGVGPVITITTPAAGGTYALGASVTPIYSCSDAASGVASCSGPASVNTGSLGLHTYTVNAADPAGNTSSLTRAYTVIWPFSWSSPPSGPSAGKDLAIKFTLGGVNHGLGVIAAGSPTSRQVDCSTGAAIGSQSATAGSLAFSGGTYTYTWTTASSWKKTCREFVLALNDGTTKTLTIQFK